MEVFKPISDFPGYTISNLGNVFSEKTNRALSPYLNATGYLYINLLHEKKNHCLRLHRLVAKEHVPGRTAERNIVDHINENRQDPTATNLRWCTQSENMRYYWNNRRRQN